MLLLQIGVAIALATVFAAIVYVERNIAVARLVAAHPKVRIECLVMTPEHVVTEVLSGHVDIGVSTDARPAAISASSGQTSVIV
ncbi:MAG TPA: hypothetical protein PLG92_15205 [Piscinibacter sp.]|nr:hypothetical protein [Piscinibacter sp.]